MRGEHLTIKRNTARLVTVCATAFLFLVLVLARPGLSGNSEPAPDFSYRFVFLQARDLPLIPDKELGEFAGILREILLKWKNVKLPQQINLQGFDYYRFFDDRHPALSDANLPIVDIFKKNNPEIAKRIKSFSELEKKYALQISGELPPDADRKIARMFYSSQNQIQKFRNKENENIVGKNRRYLSYVRLVDILFQDKHADPPVKNIYLTNSLILDDGNDMPIHTLIRGGVTNGFCEINSKSLIISYFPLYYESALFQNTSDELKSKRAEILAYLTAHELGHCMFDYADEYKDKSSLLYPFYRFEYLRWLAEKKI